MSLRSVAFASLLVLGVPALAVGEMARHIVEDGETLSSIAAQHFGNPHLWPALYRANRDQIVDPAHLYPGQSLLVPAISTTRNASAEPDGSNPARGDASKGPARP